MYTDNMLWFFFSDLELSGRRRPDTPTSSSSSSVTSSSEYDDSSDQDWEEEGSLRKRDQRKSERKLQRRGERERQRDRECRHREERMVLSSLPAEHRPLTPPPPTSPSPPSNAPSYMTWFEIEGLHCLVKKLESLPSQKKCLPDGIYDPDALILDIKVRVIFFFCCFHTFAILTGLLEQTVSTSCLWLHQGIIV